MKLAKPLLYTGYVLVGAVLCLLMLWLYNHIKAAKYPDTPYGMMLKDNCDPGKTYYRQTIAKEDYYTPWAVYNQLLLIPSARYTDKIYLIRIS